MKVNGTTISWPAVSGIVAAIFWLAGLSFQVAANDEKLRKVEDAEIDVRLARIETSLANTKENLDDMQDAQEKQSDKLDAILEKLDQ